MIVFLRRHKVLAGLCAVLVLLLVALRLALPSIAKRELNDRLARLDGPFCGHMDEFRLALIRSTYIAGGLTISRWTKDRSRCDDTVLRVRELRIGLSWSQLLHGRLRLTIDARAPTIFSDELLAALKSNSANENERGAKQAADTLVPWRIDAARLSDGSIHMRLLGTKSSAITLNDADGVFSGIEEGRQNARPVFFRLRGNVFRSAKLLVTGKVDLSASPTLWRVSYATEHLHLPDANPLLLDRVPMTFTKGNLDIYGEAAGGGPLLTGYAKLLFDHIQVVSTKERWKSFKQGVIEIVSSLFFIVTKNHELQTAGTLINFGKKDGKFSVDVAGAVRSAFEHRSGKRILRPGIENRVALPSRRELDQYKARGGAENL